MLAAGGQIAGGVAINSSFTNGGTVLGLVDSLGTLTSTGSLLGGLTLQGGSTALLSGTLNGQVVNRGVLTVNGNLASEGPGVETSDRGQAIVQSGATWTIQGGFANRSLADLGLQVDGTLQTGGDVQNDVSATAVVSRGGTITARSFLNDGTFTNLGKVNGRVVNNETLVSTGSLLGGLTQAAGASALLSGRLNGAIANSGLITVNGNLSSDDNVLEILGNGSVVVQSGATWSGVDEIANRSTNAAGLLIDGALQVTSSVQIGAGSSVNVGSGGALNAGSVVNSGTFANDGTVTTGSVTGANGVVSDGLITNNGTLKGDLRTTDSQTINNGTWNGSFTLTAGSSTVNNGTWNGNYTPSSIMSSTFENLGLLTGSGASVSEGGLLANRVGATISLDAGAALVTADASSAITNAGTINGGVGNSGSLTSTGSINGALRNRAGGRALIQAVMNGNIDNDGLITLTGATTGIGAITQTATGTFDLGGFNTTIGSLAGAGQVKLGSAALTLGGNDASTTFAGVIAGTGVRPALTKVGTGTLTLSGVNTFTGGTLVNDGTLVLAAGGQIAGGVAINSSFTNGGTVLGLVDSLGTLTSTGSLLGGLTLQGGSTALLSGTLNGPVVNLGVLTVNGNLASEGPDVDNSGRGQAIVQSGATWTIQGGFANRSLADFGLQVYGTLQTGGDLLTNAGTTTFVGSGGTITAGSLLNSGTFTNLGAFNGNAQISADAQIRNLAGGTWNGAIAVQAGGILVNAGTVEGGVLNDGTMSSAGTLNGDLTNNADASADLANIVNGTINNAGTVNLSGDIAVSGALIQTSTGLFNLANRNASLGSLSDAGSVTLGAGQLTTGSLNTSSTYSGTISGTGNLVKVGTGAFTLTGNNTGLTGVTFVNGGTLQLTSAAILGSTVSNSATLDNAGTIGGGVINVGSLISTGTINVGLDNYGTAQLQGALNGAINNAGAVKLIGITNGITALDQTAAGTFNLAGFNTTIGNIRGAGQVDLGSASLTIGSANGSGLFSGVIAGTGSMEKVGTRTLVLSGANSHTGGTTIAGGALQLGNGGTSGSIVGPVVNNAMLLVNRSDALTFASNISGTGMFAQVGTGVTTLTGANTYTGGTVVTAGRLVGNTGSLQGSILVEAPGVLEFTQGSAGTYAGSLFGAGRLDKTGAGMLTLSGNNASFTGGTFVTGGELRVTGDLRRSVVTVQNNAVLSGTGVIGGLVAQSGSTIAPGTSPGVLLVNGNVSLAAGSKVQFEIGATGPFDQILATGTASLAGNSAFSNLSAANVYAFNTTYLLLQADGGRTGTFANVAEFTGFGAIYRPELVYNGTQVLLRLVPNSLSNIAGTAPLTANQKSVVTRIDTAVAAGYNPQPLFNIYILPNAQLPGAFDQLSGEVYPVAAGVGLEQERLIKEAVLGRIGSVSAATRADAAAGKGLGAWGQYFRGWGNGGGDGNAASFKGDRNGFITGIDAGGATDTSSWRLGAFGLQIQSDITVAARGSRAHVKQSGGGVYGAFNTGDLSVALGGYLTKVDLRASREIALPGFAEANAGKTSGTARQVFAELSYTFDLGKNQLRPFVNGTIGKFKLDGLEEQGGAVALTVAKQQYTTSTATAGLDGMLNLGKRLTLAGTLAGRFQLGDRDPQAQIAMVAAPASAFAVQGAQLDKLALAARLDATLELAKNLDVALGYTGVIGKTVKDHGARATIQLRF